MGAPTVFISYRRDGVGQAFARTVKTALVYHGYDVFLDVDNLGAGFWGETILDEIASRSHFVVLLTPGALDGCDDPGNWVRREYEHARRCGRNIVPVCDGTAHLETLAAGSPQCMRSVFKLEVAHLRNVAFNGDLERLIRDFIPKSGQSGERTPNPFYGPVPHSLGEAFHGRDDFLAEIRRKYERTKVIVLSGMPGVGKSTAAAEYSHRHVYPGGVFWVGAESASDPFLALKEVARQADIILADDGPRRMTPFWNALRHRGPSLLVLDNFPEFLSPESNAAPDLRPWIPPDAATTIRVLVTIRRHIPVAGGECINVEILDPDDGLRLLCNGTSPTGTALVAARDIVEELGFLPLAIEIARAFLARNDRNYVQYLIDLRAAGPVCALENQAMEYRRFSGPLPTGREPYILATLQTSYDRCDDEAKLVLEALGLLAPEPIQIEAVAALVEDVHSISRPELQTAVTELRDGFSMIRSFNDSAQKIQAHRVVIDFARGKVMGRPQAEAINARVEAHFFSKLQIAHERTDMERLRSLAPLVVHAEAVVARADLRPPSHMVFELHHALWRYWFDYGEFTNAERHARSALRTASALEERLKTCLATHDLAKALRQRGQRDEAILQFETALTLADGVPQCPAVAAAVLSDSALALREKGRIDEAFKCACRAEELIEGEVGPQVDWLRADIFLAQGRVFQYLAQRDGKRDQLLEAKKRMSSALEIRLRHFGPRHEDVATVLDDLGACCRALGETQEAVEHLQRSVEIKAASLRDTHPYLSNSYRQLGMAYRDAGKPDRALHWLNKAVEVQSRSDDEHVRMARALGNRALVLCELDRLDEALEDAKNGVEIQKSQSGDRTNDVALRRMELAEVYNAKGDIGRAMHEIGEAHDILAANGLSSHVDMGTVLRTRAESLLLLNMTEQAVADARRAVAILDALEKDHPRTARAKAVLERALAPRSGVGGA